MGSDAPDDGPTEPPPEVVDGLLEEPRRRRLLAVLQGADEPVPIRRVARRIAAAEQGADPDAVPEEAATRVERSLYDRHLPKLTALEVVSFDSLLACLEPGSNADAVFERWRDRSGAGELPEPPDGSESDKVDNGPGRNEG